MKRTNKEPKDLKTPASIKKLVNDTSLAAHNIMCLVLDEANIDSESAWLIYGRAINHLFQRHYAAALIKPKKKASNK